MIRGLIVLLTGVMLYSQSTRAQDICDFDYQLHALKQKSPEDFQKLNQGYLDALKHIYTKNKQTHFDTTIRIPVYFHVLYKPNQIVSDNQLDELLQMLNQGFNAQTDTSVVRSVFKERVSDVGIEFFRAVTDINGDTIARTNKRFEQANFTRNTINEVKREEWGLKAYYPRQYLNIWIASVSGISGHGTPPQGAANWDGLSPFPDSLQGIVLNRSLFLSNSYKGSNSHLITHEVGHYLGLRHIWGDELQVTTGDSIICANDDGIEDTPPSFSPSWSCDYTKNTCNAYELNDLPDMIENFMDYTPSNCKVMFTQDQKALMLYNLYAFRPELVGYKVDTIESPQTPYQQLATLHIIPNPNQGSFKLKFKGLKEIGGKMRIYNVYGKELVNQSMLFQDDVTYTYPLLQRGIYFVEIDSYLGENLITEKFIVGE